MPPSLQFQAGVSSYLTIALQLSKKRCPFSWTLFLLGFRGVSATTTEPQNSFLFIGCRRRRCCSTSAFFWNTSIFYSVLLTTSTIINSIIIVPLLIDFDWIGRVTAHADIIGLYKKGITLFAFACLCGIIVVDFGPLHVLLFDRHKLLANCSMICALK